MRPCPVMFKIISIGFNRHEPCTSATSQHRFLEMWEHRDLMRYATEIVLFCGCAGDGYLMYVNDLRFSSYCIECLPSQ